MAAGSRPGKKTSISLILIFIFVLVSAQGERQDTLKQYLFPAFAKNKVLTKNGTSSTLVMNYNIISENVVFIQKGKYFDLASPETVDTAWFGDRAFIPREKCFLEVLCKGKVSFFIRDKGVPVPPPKPGGYGTASETSATDVISGINTPQGYYNLKLPEGFTVRVSNSFYVRVGDIWTRFLNENQMLKAFPGKEKELKQFIKDNHLRVTRRDDLVRIGIFCNNMLSNR